MTIAQLYCRLWAVFLSQMHSVSLLFSILLAQSAQCCFFMHQLYVVAQVNTIMGSAHFGATYSIRVLEIFFWVSVIPTDTQGCKLVSPDKNLSVRMLSLLM